MFTNFISETYFILIGQLLHWALQYFHTFSIPTNTRIAKGNQKRNIISLFIHLHVILKLFDFLLFNIKDDCDEWGGAESRGNGARPVELTIMSDTCATHRSRVPRRSSGRIKGGVTTVEDERGPGLDFNLCFVCGSRPWGAAALLLCLFIFY